MSAKFDDRLTRAKLGRLKARMPLIMARALFKEGEIEMGEAKRRTPVDTGALRSTGRVAQPKIALDGTSVELSFGGPAAGYAVPVHENLSAFHTVGQAKYLESVVLESIAFLPARVGRSVELELSSI